MCKIPGCLSSRVPVISDEAEVSSAMTSVTVAQIEDVRSYYRIVLGRI